MMTRASLFAIAVLFLYGSAANALTHVTPPGNSGATQYQEDVPSAAGAVPVTKLASEPSSGGEASQALPHSVVTQLNHDGSSGRALVQLANRTAPTAVTVRRSHSRNKVRPHSNTNTPVVSTPVVSGVGSQIAGAVVGGSGGGLGLALPGALAGFLVVAIAIVLARRRRTR
jgi:hypothetical protein